MRVRWLTDDFSLAMVERDARIRVRTLSDPEARGLAADARCAVACVDTAAVFAHTLDLAIPPQRLLVELAPGDELLVGQLRGPRLPEGARRLPPGVTLTWHQVVCEAREEARPAEGELATVGTPELTAPASPVPSSTSLPGAAGTDPPATAVQATGPSDPGPSAPPDRSSTVSLSPNTAQSVQKAEPAPPPEPLDTRSVETIFHEIRKAAAWGDRHRLADERAALLARFPSRETDADAAAEDGRQQARARAELDRVARAEGVDGPAFAQMATDITTRWPGLARQVENARSFHAGKAANAARESALRAEGRPLTTVRATGDRRVLALAPAAHFTLLIDEAGERFSSAGPGREGRFVSVLVPDTTSLPPLKVGFHSAGESDETLDAAMQALLDAEVGVLGVTLADLSPTPGERWVDGVLELVDWVLLLLPRQGPVDLDVRVEARGTFLPGQNWEVAARDLLRKHAARDPASARGVRLRIRAYAKAAEPRLGYADLVAHTWNGGTEPSRARLAATGLRGRCLLEGALPALRSAWDSFSRDRVPSAETWSRLVQDPASADPLAIAGLLSARLAERARAEPRTWHLYLDATLAHLESKAVDVPRLGRELAWIANAAPEQERLPPAARHAWALARLAEANHLGAVAADAEAEVETLGDLLLDERAPAVCHGDLHRAVLATNRFDFAAASQALARWEEVDPRVPGLLMWARVRSSLGQHAAFEGRFPEAVVRFDEALAAFERLSDPRGRRGETAQTATYRAIARMDDPAVSRDDTLRALESVLGPIAEALPRLAASTAPADRYSVHLLYRWAVQRGKERTHAALLERAGRWQLGAGHPWPLIALYRAELLEGAGRSDEALDQLGRGLDAAWHPSQGPTVRFIGLVLAAVLAGRGGRRDSRTQAVITLSRTELPAAEERIGRVVDELNRPGDTREFLRRVLPFNFR